MFQRYLKILENISVAKVDNVHVRGNVTSVGCMILSKLPDYHIDMYNRSCTNVKDESLQETLAEVIVKHQQAFAKNKHDLGTSPLVKYRINTKDATPVRQPLRRTPKAFEGEEEKHLNDQLKAGVITPSKSSWASPVVLVRKKDQSVRWCIDIGR